MAAVTVQQIERRARRGRPATHAKLRAALAGAGVLIGDDGVRAPAPPSRPQPVREAKSSR